MQRLLLLLLLSSLVLPGCGFRLRGTSNIAPRLQTLELRNINNTDALYQVVKTRFTRNQLTLVDDHSDVSSVPVITLLQDKMDRRLLSLFSSGQVAEYELVYTVSYSIQLPGQQAQKISFDIVREYQDDPNAVLAKSRELELILNEIRIKAADKILQRLASFAPVPAS